MTQSPSQIHDTRARAAAIGGRLALAMGLSSAAVALLAGPSYRADAWAALEQNPSLSNTELARKTYCAFATAWQVKRDFLLLRPLSFTKREGLLG